MTDIQFNLRAELRIVRRILILLSIYSAISLISLFLIPVFYMLNIMLLQKYFLLFLWYSFFIYISYVVKKAGEIDFLVIFTVIIVSIAVIWDIIGVSFGLYDDANYFFKLRYDIFSHFFAGAVFFLVIVMILSLLELRFRIEYLAILFTNIGLFLYEILEEIIDFFLGDMIESLNNPFFWNSIQDMIMNLVGSFLMFIIFKRYLRKHT